MICQLYNREQKGQVLISEEEVDELVRTFLDPELREFCANFEDVPPVRSGVRLFGIPGSTKTSLLRFMYESGYIHHQRPEDQDLNLAGIFRMQMDLSDREKAPITKIANADYLLHILLEQYVIGRYNNVLATQDAYSHTGTVERLFTGEVGGPVMPMISFCALGGLKDIPPSLMSLVDCYEWGPSVSICIDTRHPMVHEDYDRRCSVMSVFKQIRDINEFLMKTGSIDYTFIAPQVTRRNRAEKIAAFHNGVVAEVSEHMARLTGVLYVDLSEFYKRLQQSVPGGEHSYSPLLFLTYLSKNRILLPSLREQQSFQYVLENILHGYLQTIPGQRRVFISEMNPAWYKQERRAVKARCGLFTDAANHSLQILERMMFIRNLLMEALA